MSKAHWREKAAEEERRALDLAAQLAVVREDFGPSLEEMQARRELVRFVLALASRSSSSYADVEWFVRAVDEANEAGHVSDSLTVLLLDFAERYGGRGAVVEVRS